MSNVRKVSKEEQENPKKETTEGECLGKTKNSDGAHSIPTVTLKYTSAKNKRNNEEIYLGVAGNRDYIQLNENYYFNKNYIIGSGGFGKVYYGTDANRTTDYAVKMESTKFPDNLGYEHDMLKKFNGLPGFPKVFYRGETKKYRYLVQSLLGPSLDKFFGFCDKKFGLLTCVRLGEQMLQRIKDIHSKQMIHRDIKPSNFAFGRLNIIQTNPNKRKKKFQLLKNDKYFEDEFVYLIDFGLTAYALPVSYIKHYSKGELSFVGTLRYAPLNSHLLKRQTKQDDLFSFFYVFMYFLNGRVPWENLEIKDKVLKAKRVGEIKQNLETLPEFLNLPQDIKNIYFCIKNIKDANKPNYDGIFQIFSKIKNELAGWHIVDNMLWEWENKLLLDRPKIIYNLKETEAKKKELKSLFNGYPIEYESYLEYILYKYTTNFASNDIFKEYLPGK